MRLWFFRLALIALTCSCTGSRSGAGGDPPGDGSGGSGGAPAAPCAEITDADACEAAGCTVLEGVLYRSFECEAGEPIVACIDFDEDGYHGLSPSAWQREVDDGIVVIHLGVSPGTVDDFVNCQHPEICNCHPPDHPEDCPQYETEVDCVNARCVFRPATYFATGTCEGGVKQSACIWHDRLAAGLAAPSLWRRDDASGGTTVIGFGSIPDGVPGYEMCAESPEICDCFER